MIRHGHRSGYRDDGCRCDECKRAIALEHNIYKMRRNANGGRPLMVAKLGSVRRLQSLMALGWPRRELAKRAGYKGDAFALVLNSKRRWLTPTTAARIDALYETLSMTLGPSNPTRIYAHKAGWPPPLAWDDIDTDEQPQCPRDTDVLDEVVVQRVIDGHGRPRTLTRLETAEVVRRLRADGRSEYEIAKRFGLKPERYGKRGAA